MNVVIPSDFDNAIQTTQVAKQALLQYNYTKQISEIQGETLVLQEQYNQQISVSQATANANATIITTNATANAIIQGLAIEKTMMQNIS